MSAETAPQKVFQNGEAEVANEQNGNEMEDESMQDIGELDSSKPIRIIRKAKRLGVAKSPGKVSEDGTMTGPVSPTSGTTRLPFTKNSRKSRNGPRGRGLPKKGGAGGKGTWGFPGDELFEERSRDPNDPNFDDSEQEYFVEQIAPPILDEEFNRIIEPLLLEYLENGDSSEVEASLRKLNLDNVKPKLIELSVGLALDRKAAHREMTSVLISDLYGKILSRDDISQGFDDTLKALADLTIDTPDAPMVVGQFIARAVADDCLAPKFVQSYKGNVDSEHSRSALDKAQLLLSMKHGIVRLDNIWGTGGGIRPVKYLIRQMVLLLKEYLSSGDIAEATRCLLELEVPHFHHEVVYEATVMVLEESNERSAERMCKLLKSLSDAIIVTPEQMSQGFKRVYDALPDICLDVPSAYTLIEKFSDLGYKEGVISENLYKELPQRGRKRFVSEGDGGRIKEPAV